MCGVGLGQRLVADGPSGRILSAAQPRPEGLGFARSGLQPV